MVAPREAGPGEAGPREAGPGEVGPRDEPQEVLKAGHVRPCTCSIQVFARAQRQESKMEAN